EAGALNDVDDALDILVRDGRLLRELRVRRAPHHDPVRHELLAQLAASDLRLRGRPTERAARAVACARERDGARAETGEHEGRRAHAAGDEHRLADPAIGGWDVGVARPEGPRRALSVDADALAAVLLDLRDVV